MIPRLSTHLCPGTKLVLSVEKLLNEFDKRKPTRTSALDLFHPHLSFLAHNKADLPMISTKVLGLSKTSKLKPTRKLPQLCLPFLSTLSPTAPFLPTSNRRLIFTQNQTQLKPKQIQLDPNSYSTPTYPILAWSSAQLFSP